MRSYSIDFRQKIIDVRQQEGISIRKLAERFRVTKGFVQKLVKQHQETGDITPRRPGGSPPRKLNHEQIIMLMEMIEAQNDATLKELSEWVEQTMGVKVSKSTLGRITKSLKYTLKKNDVCSGKKE